MKRTIAMILAICMVFALLACRNRPIDTEFTSGDATTADDLQVQDKETESNEENQQEQEEEPVYPIATITMENGDVMKVELYPDVAPNTVKNFISLANSGYYDGLTFHRIVSGFMIQGGCPLGTGTGGPGYSIKGEFLANGVDNRLSHERGVISMARSQAPDSAGSQFFIMHQDYKGLDGQYAAFGKLIEGFVVLDRLAATPTEYDAYGYEKSHPIDPVVIQSITVDTFGVDYGEPEVIQ